MNPRAILLGLWIATLTLVACKDESTPDRQMEPDPDGGTPGDQCDVKPLDAYCDVDYCPESLSAGVDNKCAQGDDAEVQANDCGGSTLITRAGLGSIQYHFDADDELIGVHTFSDTVRRCSPEQGAPSSSEQRFGRECALEGAPMLACEMLCPAIACFAGATFQTDWPFGFAQATEIPIEVCRNSDCYSGMLRDGAMTPGEGSGVGFTTPEPEVSDREMKGHVEVVFFGASDGEVYVQVQWWAWAKTDLHDGDRYLVTAAAPGGDVVLVDQEVDYMLQSAGCDRDCPFVEQDLRGTVEIGGDGDGGVDDDAGAL